MARKTGKRKYCGPQREIPWSSYGIRGWNRIIVIVIIIWLLGGDPYTGDLCPA